MLEWKGEALPLCVTWILYNGWGFLSFYLMMEKEVLNEEMNE